MKTKVWVSKYALAGGITEHEAEIREGFAYPGAPFMSFTGFAMGKEAHDTREGAVAAAENMRLKKIISVKKQLAKLEKLRFE